MKTAYLLIGGNLGERQNYLGQARILIGNNAGKVLKMSNIYETAAWGITDQAAFLNQVLLIETDYSPNQLLKEILNIETKLGRKRTIKYGPRTIDIDILLFGKEIIDQPDLTVPHPALPERRFALIPLNEIASQLVHPVLKKSIQQLLEESKDDLRVDKFSG